MSRLSLVPLLACLLLAACKIERTPEEYYDGRFLPTPDLEARRGEIEETLSPLLQARSPDAVRRALDRLPTVPDLQMAGSGAGDADEARFAGAPDASVMVGEAGEIGWFLVRYDDRDVVSGVTERREGVWRVVQLHHAPGVTPTADRGAEERGG